MQEFSDGSTEQEKRTNSAIYALMAAILFLNNLPYILAISLTPDGQVFSGALHSHADVFSYYAKMHLGWDGGWQYVDPYTTEAHQPSLLFVFYVFLGHLARWSHLSIVATYHTSRILSGILLLIGIDRMLRTFEIGGTARIIAFSLAFLGGGVWWLTHLTGFNDNPMEYWLTEGYAFQSMLNYPHFAITSALMVWALLDLYRFSTKLNGGWSLARLACSAFGIAWVHPRLLLTLCVVGGSSAIWGYIRKQWPLRRWMGGLAVICAAGAPPAFLIWNSYRADPILREWAATLTETPAPFWMLLGYGFLWPLAWLGAYRVLRAGQAWGTFMIAWLIAGSLIIYLPLISQRRLAQGLNFPLAILSGYLIAEHVVPRLRQWAGEHRTRVHIVFGLLLLSMSTFCFLGLSIKPAFRGEYPWYYSQSRAEAFQWLAEHTGRRETVLCSYLSGEMIPAFAGNRVVLGHWAETVYREKVEAEVKRFFDPRTNSADREAMVRRWGVGYIFLSGRNEFELGGYDPYLDPEHWRLVFQNLAIRIFGRAES
ncbi:hypothetical protein HYR69_00765 [Candidatus Sumerlaeota bacterium]|nr:hypothetical protein [Candidatus Sumerlaeota bacterium]